ncbi:thioredoxin domain-containing protein [Paraflavisolibacter sp. H34]|uniref:DsbA family protein n=1 Tax=Huijunlia imazamoxiresistens TaxID=3127457 RepID=UPI003015EA8D
MRQQKELAPVIEPKDVVIGDPAAPITITEFGDYESEACAKAAGVVNSLLEKYAGKVNFVFRHFPLTRIHQRAHKAAEAAIAAAQEGKFFEMHQALFDNRRNLGVISLKSYAKEIGVTNKRFLDDLINGTYGWNVQGDLMEGIHKGVTNVPAFFLNEERFEQEPTLERLSARIDSLLKGKVSGSKTSKKLRA